MKKLLFSLLVLPLLGLSNHALSQTTKTFMKVSSSGYAFNGGVTVMGYENQIGVYSYSDGIQGCTSISAGAMAGSGACKPSFSPFSMLIALSSAVTDFRSAMLQGKLLNSIDVVQVKTAGGGSTAYYKIHMENVSVSSIQEGSADESPTISISLNPVKIAWQVITQNADGSPGPASSYGWDFSKNNAFNYHF